MDQPSIHHLLIRNRIRDWRREMSVTQEQLADAVGVSRQSIISVELGKCQPSVPLAISIAQFFHLSMEQLFITDDSIEHVAAISHRNEIADSSLNSISELFDAELRPGDREQIIMPQVNMYQTIQDLIVEADVPGLNENDVDIEIQDGTLTIKGIRQRETENHSRSYIHREFLNGSFERTITLPIDIVPERATATVTNGQLKVALPKATQAAAVVHKVKPEKAG